MKRTGYIRRSNPKKPGEPSRAVRIQRQAPIKPFRPTATERAFNAWCIAETKAGDPLCLRCRGEATDCMHLFRLGAGASRFDWNDWRNYPSARAMGCRQDHVAMDERREWGLDPESLARREEMARKEMAIFGVQWEARARRAA